MYCWQRHVHIIEQLAQSAQEAGITGNDLCHVEIERDEVNAVGVGSRHFAGAVSKRETEKVGPELPCPFGNEIVYFEAQPEGLSLIVVNNKVLLPLEPDAARVAQEI